MITLFSIPKPFQGQIAILQNNALQSWRKACPTCEIFLCGNEIGTAEAASKFGSYHISDIAKNEYNTPFLDSAFEKVAKVAKYKLLCYVNSDIILTPQFFSALKKIKFRRFLAVGQRWDVDLSEPWDFAQDDWNIKLQNYVQEKGKLHTPTGSDFFVFPLGMNLEKIPPFVVGRAGWDNWFIYRARQLSIHVVNLTPMVKVIHQNHSYNHVPLNNGNGWFGPESDQNITIAGGTEHIFTLLDSTHLLTPTGIRKANEPPYSLRQKETYPILHPVIKKWFWLKGLLFRAFRRMGRLLAKKVMKDENNSSLNR